MKNRQWYYIRSMMIVTLFYVIVSSLIYLLRVENVSNFNPVKFLLVATIGYIILSWIIIFSNIGYLDSEILRLRQIIVEHDIFEKN